MKSNVANKTQYLFWSVISGETVEKSNNKVPDIFFKIHLKINNHSTFM